MTTEEMHILRTQQAHVFNARVLFLGEVQRIFKPGTTHLYRHGDHPRWVTVVEVSGDRISVQGKSGTKYWIDVYRFIEEGLPCHH